MITVLCVACDPAGKKWQEAKEADTVPAYRSFLDEHPESKYGAQALQAIDDLTYQSAVSANTEDEFEEYIRNFPEGASVSDARARLEKLSLDRFVGNIDDHILGFINGTETDIVALQGKPWIELDINRSLKSGGFDIYNGRPVIRENSQMVFQDPDEQFQFLGTTIAEPQYSEFAKLAKLEESVFEAGVKISLKSGVTLQYDGDEWAHVNTESLPTSDQP
ncbi:MAG: hypothetical protein OEW68_08830 [Gammaproteobacteria bacterium]|nr:hypothetical protein [Gammaproteobacteria bacterium]MDH4314931.1 hypothetical protein [Gammaproteobacteria bacterium]MDH5214188.1 hypothetical protein [Gammaproteobacteria bacterium]